MIFNCIYLFELENQTSDHGKYIFSIKVGSVCGSNPPQNHQDCEFIFIIIFKAISAYIVQKLFSRLGLYSQKVGGLYIPILIGLL